MASPSQQVQRQPQQPVQQTQFSQPQSTAQQINAQNPQNIQNFQNIPNYQQHPLPKNRVILYTITLIISFFVLVILTGAIILASSFLHYFVSYMMIAALAFVIGLITCIILSRLVDAQRKIFAGIMIISILGVAATSIIIMIMKHIEQQMAAFNAGTDLGVMSMFGPSLNPVISGILIFMGFNLYSLFILFKGKKQVEETESKLK